MDKKILKWNFIFQYGYVLTNVFNSILLLPLYVKNIDANTLGVWIATSSILNYMTIVDPGIGEVLQQKIAELRGRKEHHEIGKSIGSGLFSSSVILLIAILVGLACYFSLGFIIDKDVTKYPNLSIALMLTIIATGMSLVSFTMSGINQGLLNSAHVAISSISANFLFLFINILFLFLDYGVMSIAFANLCRAVYINIFNFVSMNNVLKREQMKMSFEFAHFKKFIRIFSFTSTSRIITGISYSIDMIVLARFIAPGMITIYEINKRPLNLTNALIGRHSVALMPVISHAKGSGNKEAIMNLIRKQFILYSYAALFMAFMFALNYENLITIWAGQGNFIGHNILYLLVAYNFVFLISYFMSNMGYALGDIKKNSKFNIIRNIFYAIIVFFAAMKFGIIGAIVTSLALTFVADLFYFSYRVHVLGYLNVSFIKATLSRWAIIIPACCFAGWGFQVLVENLVTPNMYFLRLLVNGSLFSIFFLLLLLSIDSSLRNKLKQLKEKIRLYPVFK